MDHEFGTFLSELSLAIGASGSRAETSPPINLIVPVTSPSKDMTIRAWGKPCCRDSMTNETAFVWTEYFPTLETTRFFFELEVEHTISGPGVVNSIFSGFQVGPNILLSSIGRNWSHQMGSAVPLQTLLDAFHDMSRISKP